MQGFWALQYRTTSSSVLYGALGAYKRNTSAKQQAVSNLTDEVVLLMKLFRTRHGSNGFNSSRWSSVNLSCGISSKYEARAYNGSQSQTPHLDVLQRKPLDSSSTSHLEPLDCLILAKLAFQALELGSTLLTLHFSWLVVFCTRSRYLCLPVIATQ
jgi:hypothetical protein